MFGDQVYISWTRCTYPLPIPTDNTAHHFRDHPSSKKKASDFAKFGIPFSSTTGWWFQIFFIFTPIWGRLPIWLIFFKWVETTNQLDIFKIFQVILVTSWPSPCLVLQTFMFFFVVFLTSSKSLPPEEKIHISPGRWNGAPLNPNRTHLA